MDKTFTISHLRAMMHALYPEVEDDRLFRNCEHPMSAVGLVLLSAAIMGTTDARDLMLFTAYSRTFLAAIALNMENNRLWVGGRYVASTWLSPDGTIDHNCFWEHIQVGSGGLWMPGGDLDIWADACFIFWDEHGVPDGQSV